MSTRLALLLCAAGLVFCALAATGVLPATEDAPRSLLDPAPHPEPEEPLANGVYEVVASSFRREELALLDDDSVVRVYDGQFVRGRDAHPPEYVLLRTRGYAPLLLSRPAKVVDPHGSPKLHMTLTTEAGTALHALTGRAKLAAVVVGDAIVTVHRIRVAIEGGLLQVSC